MSRFAVPLLALVALFPAAAADDKPSLELPLPTWAKQSKAWTRQNAAIPIDEDRDYISDNGDEVYSILKERGITTLMVMGVHTNMCVLNRSFAIKAMTRRGVRCVLIRDLTDAMYNPA